jgi:outer membrane lipoprotein SlyB
MKSHTALALASLALVTFGAGCAGYGPNTQQGAVIGAAGGALAGGVIGNNRGSGNALSGAAIGAAAGGIAGAAIGNSVDHQRGTIYTEQDARTEYVVPQPPAPPAPPPREIVTARPAREAVWVEGYWAYAGHGNRYEWVPGHWEVPPPRYRTFVQPRWERRGNGYVYMRGYWR